MVTCRDINKTWNDNLLLADVHGVLSKIARVWGLIPCQALPTSWYLTMGNARIQSGINSLSIKLAPEIPV
jgi:hypothetical protein